LPKSTRLTLEAHRVPLVTVLDAVARQANLVLAPMKDAKGKVIGILITRPATLKVNGQAQSFSEGPTLPWSPEWGIPPTALVGTDPAMGGTIAHDEFHDLLQYQRAALQYQKATIDQKAAIGAMAPGGQPLTTVPVAALPGGYGLAASCPLTLTSV